MMEFTATCRCGSPLNTGITIETIGLTVGKSVRCYPMNWALAPKPRYFLANGGQNARAGKLRGLARNHIGAKWATSPS